MPRWRWGWGWGAEGPPDPVTVFFSALSSPRRLMIVELLKGGEMSLAELSQAVGLDPSVVYRHLRVLWAAGIVEARRFGPRLLFRVSNPAVFEVIEIVRNKILKTGGE